MSKQRQILEYAIPAKGAHPWQRVISFPAIAVVVIAVAALVGFNLDNHHRFKQILIPIVCAAAVLYVIGRSVKRKSGSRTRLIKAICGCLGLVTGLTLFVGWSDMPAIYDMYKYGFYGRFTHPLGRISLVVFVASVGFFFLADLIDLIILIMRRRNTR